MNLNSLWLAWSLRLIMVGVLMPLGNSVFAQQGAGQLEEVIVTATKRGGVGVQDIPLSVQAISGDTLEEQGAIDFDDYFRQVPGLSV